MLLFLLWTLELLRPVPWSFPPSCLAIELDVESQSWVWVQKSLPFLPGQPAVSSHRTQPFCSGKPASRASNVDTQGSQSLLWGGQRERTCCAWQSNRIFCFYLQWLRKTGSEGLWSWEGIWRWCRRRLATGTLTLSKREPNICSPNVVDEVARFTHQLHIVCSGSLQVQCTQECVTEDPDCRLI